MNKTAIKNFAVWARNKLIADITYKAGLIGVSEKGIAQPLSQSSKDLQFFDIGTKDYVQVAGSDIEQRNALVRAIQEKERTSDYKTAFKAVIEEVAYTWFNRLIAIRFMEVNEYLPSRIRVLSSENPAKNEPDFVTTPFDTDMEFTMAEHDKIMQLKDENKLDELFRMLFIKQCNKLNGILPELFEETNNYTELLLSISFTDHDGVVYHLVHDITEYDFNIEKEGQVEIIGWMYQYYNIEPKDETFALLKKNVKITKERIPAATQLFTPDWIVRYMVENSLGRLWVEGHPSDSLKENWKYYLEEAEQEASVQAKLEQIRAEYRNLNPEDIKVIDPCMGSGHILVYCFDVLMQIYESQGYTQRDAVQSILGNNLFGLDIDKRAAQLAYFAVMMKARQYDRRIFTREIKPHVYAIEESNGINRGQLKYFGADLSPIERNKAKLQVSGLLDTMVDAKEYGSILNVENYDWELLQRFAESIDDAGQMSLDIIGINQTQVQLLTLIQIAHVLSQKYDAVITNPPYMGNRGMSAKLTTYVQKYHPNSKSDMFAVFIEQCRYMTKFGSYYGMITQPSFLFLTVFEALRKEIISKQTIVNLLHMGRGVFGIDFGSTAFVIKNEATKNYIGSYMKLHQRTFQYIAPEDIEGLFMNAKENHEFEYDFTRYNSDIVTEDEPEAMEITDNQTQKLFYTIRQNNFLMIPGTPIAYWLSPAFIDAFQGQKLGDVAEIITGMTTGNNNEFVRLWYEVDRNACAIGYKSMDKIDFSECKWIPYSKGGNRRNWAGNADYVVNWLRKDEFNRSKTTLQHLYLREGLTWPFISSGKFSARYLPHGFLWDVAGSPCFFDNKKEMLYALGFLCTKIADQALKIMNPTINVQAIDLAKLPFIYDKDRENEIVSIVKRNIFLSSIDWDASELSWEFKKHPMVRYGKSLKDAYKEWESECDSRFTELKQNEEDLNAIFAGIYGLNGELNPTIAEADVTVFKADAARDIRSLISYAVGCMFGRYSLDVEGLTYAGGEWDDSKYSTFIPDRDNCIPITDEAYFEDDIVGQFVDWMKKAFGEENLEANLDFIAKALGNKGTTSREVIRNYFLNDFMKEHIKIYQKRPIYWLFDSGKQNGFKALVYMHRWNADTVGNLRVEYLHKMQHTYEREIIRMQETIDNSRASREVSKATKRKDKLQKQLKETKDYDAKLAHIALSRIDIDLDDGVKVNYEKVQTGRDGRKMQILAKI